MTSRPRAGRRPPECARRFGRLVVVVLALAVTAGIVGAPVYVTPRLDPLQRADAIVVLGGPGYERYPYGLELAEQGYAPRVVMSNPAGAEDIWLTDLCSHQRYTFAVDCFSPHPATTRGEAREIAALARKYRWRTVIVVTFRPHISRARFIIQRCFDGDLIMAESPAELTPDYWIFSYLYQTAGYVRAAFQSGC